MKLTSDIYCAKCGYEDHERKYRHESCPNCGVMAWSNKWVMSQTDTEFIKTLLAKRQKKS